MQRLTTFLLELYCFGFAGLLLLGVVRLFGPWEFAMRDFFRLIRTALAWPFMLVSAGRRSRLMQAIHGGLQ